MPNYFKGLKDNGIRIFIRLLNGFKMVSPEKQWVAKNINITEYDRGNRETPVLFDNFFFYLVK